MSSGMKSLVINTQERAISPDINRLQAFKARDVAEIFRYLINVGDNRDLSPGVVVENAAIASPLSAEVINGLTVDPQLGSLDLYIKPGLLYAIAPDAGADDSNYKFAKSSGVVTPGALTMAANGSVSVRIDIIECSLTESIVETDNRDIFNPSTGLFTAATVTKAREGALTFRVRTGVPGSGFPGFASGWLPLAVASVPGSASNNDSITFWDVRPVVSDRVEGITNSDYEMPVWGEMNFRVQNNGGTTPCNLTGICRVGYRGRWLGGRLRRGTQGASDTDTVNLRNLDVQEGSGVVMTNNAIFYLYLMVPFGLPRWARYSKAASGSRTPRSPNGILVVSKTPCDVRSRPISQILLPNGLGFAGALSAEGVCISAGVIYNGGGSNFGFGGLYTQNRKTVLSNVLTSIPNTVTPGVGIWARGFAIPDTHFPGNAKSMLIKTRGFFQSPNVAIARHNFNGIDMDVRIREEAVPNVTTGFTSFTTRGTSGFTLRVLNDDVYYTGTETGTDVWVPIAGAIWPNAFVHPANGYDVEWVGGWQEQETFPIVPIVVSAALYVQGWEF